ncbi:hypothetical protein L249_2383 [Ophiocordyceps polyrhachis-furcata BCC 54312]|uniref:Uncharacterized protein n=1 Tax=Ophiocordyceps polyrhachis-furcata BCC 54312 TaxID=1330021 RepID=A0A367LNB4_9HYPO|nr:hypothetical protein L249_2383 [Ophiocordyceps polyrhachis-furcata BCC 54312]
MGNGEKKWDATAERDLCISIIMSISNEGKASYNWPRVTTSMEALGHGFTKDAMSQHFSKVICKDFKNRRGEMPPESTTPSATATPRKRKPAALKLIDENGEGGGDVDDDANVTPSKAAAATPRKRKSAKLAADDGAADVGEAGVTPKKAAATPRKRRAAKKAPVSDDKVDASPPAAEEEADKTLAAAAAAAAAATTIKADVDGTETSADGGEAIAT